MDRFARLAPFLLALAVYLVAWRVQPLPPTGDEPHYLLTAWSLVHDGDVDLRDEYARSDGASLGVAPHLEPHACDYRHDGRLIPLHGVGLALLLAPVVALGGGLAAVRLELIVLAALLAWELHRLLRDLGLGGAREVWAAWVAVVFCLPLVVYAGQVYAEVPGALLVVLGLRRLILAPTVSRLWIAAAAAALLPWLHVRFGLLALVLAAGVAWRGWRALGARGLLPLTAFALSLAALAGCFALWYGSPLPSAPFHVAGHFPEGPTWTLESLYRHAAGLFLSRAFGWLPFAPVHVLAVAGLVPLVRLHPRQAALPLAGAGLYLLLASARMASQGAAFPGRLVVCLVPLAAVPLLVAMTRGPIARLAFVPLLALSLAITVAAVASGARLYTRGAATTEVPIAASLQGLWPAIPLLDPAAALHCQAARLRREVGAVVPDPRKAGPAVRAAEPERPGLLAFGPLVVLKKGAYAARFELAATAESAERPVAVVAVVDGSGAVVAQRLVRAADLPADGWGVATLPFFAAGELLGPRVVYLGRGEVWARGIHFEPRGGEPHERFPGWRRSLAWLVALAVCGVGLAWRSAPPAAPPSDQESPSPR
ncbi:MAG TPA: hypothetical protein VGE98_08885, partial [Thermoanaerobaculia bacterium]